MAEVKIHRYAVHHYQRQFRFLVRRSEKQPVQPFIIGGFKTYELGVNSHGCNCLRYLLCGDSVKTFKSFKTFKPKDKITELFDAILSVEFFEETALVDSADDACIDQIIRVDLANFRVLGFHDPLKSLANRLREHRVCGTPRRESGRGYPDRPSLPRQDR